MRRILRRSSKTSSCCLERLETPLEYNLYYNIAGLVIAMADLPGMKPLASFAPFACPPAQPDLTLEIRSYPEGEPPVPEEAAMELVSEDVVNRLYVHEDRLIKRTAMREGDPRCMWTVVQTDDFSHATIYLPDTWLDYDAYGNAFVIEKMILPHHGMMLHCSLIEWNGMGIAFTAPSQTGKSTQARLWQEHQGAEILNGDRAVLRALPDGLWAYGSPWAGSSQYYVNRRTPLKAIVILEQGPENRIRRVDHTEGLSWFLIGSSLPLWEPALLEYGMQTLERIVTEVPMYLLSCRPDEGAVEALRKCLI